jgi:hypothetical protein
MRFPDIDLPNPEQRFHLYSVSTEKILSSGKKRKKTKEQHLSPE